MFKSMDSQDEGVKFYLGRPGYYCNPALAAPPEEGYNGN
jgi:hypothetical protein